MKGGNASILIAVGILILYLAITGKLDCFVGAFKCAFLGQKNSGTQSSSGGQGAGGFAFPKISLGNYGGATLPTF